MLLPLQAPEIWDELNQSLQENLGTPKDNPVKCYPNLYVAVDEVCTQIASFLSHKKAFTWTKGFSPLFEGSLAGFLRDGLQVQSVDWKVFEQVTIDPVAWVEALPKDTLFVLGFEDHAVTGQKLNLQIVEEALNQKKIFFIRVSHFQLPPKEQELKPYTIWIGPTGVENYSAVVCGARFRAPERIVPYHPWKKISFSDRITLDENAELVQKFENLYPDEKWFDDRTSRRFDRVLLGFKTVTGDALRRRLLVALNQPSDSELITTPHVCFLKSLRALKSWWTPNPEPDKLRGLILIETCLLEEPQFAEIFAKTLTNLKKESQWPPI